MSVISKAAAGANHEHGNAALPAIAATLQDPLPGESENRTPKPDVPTRFFQRKTTVIAVGAVVGILAH